MPSNLVEDICLPYLLKAQNENGGWGFKRSSTSRAEPTAWAILALLESAASRESLDAVSRAVRYLAQTQLPDGSWPSSPEQSEGSWVTSLACWALLGNGENSGNIERGLSWLCTDVPGEAKPLRRLLRNLMRKRSVAAQNEGLYGWSWTPGTASWVEPTSYALILLRQAPEASLSEAMISRREVGEAMLYDRICPGGGWNCGNPMVYGVPGQPQVGPTVWALLALKEHTERSEVQESLRWLEADRQLIQSPASLALWQIAIRAYNKPSPAGEEKLLQMYSQSDVRWGVHEAAWAILSLSGTQNWLSRNPNGIR